MKKIALFLMACVAMIPLASCSSDDGGGGINVNVGSVRLKSGAVAGAKALAVAAKSGATKGVATRAAGDATQVDDALFRVSDDGKYIAVTYTYDVEVKDGDGEDAQTVIQRVQQDLRITPKFIFKVGSDYLWLANCFYSIPNYEQLPEDGVKKALTQIRDQFNEAHRSTHGVQYLIRKSDGAMWQWEAADGGPQSMDDGWNPQSMLNGWFHEVGGKMYVRVGGYDMLKGQNLFTGRVVRLTVSGSSLSSQEVIPASDNITRILPAGDNLCLIQTDGQRYPTPLIYLTASNTTIPLKTPQEGGQGTVRWSAVSIDGKLYAIRNSQTGDIYGNTLGFYHVTISGNQAVVGNKIAEMNTSVGFNDDKFFGVGYATTAKTFSFFSQDSQNNWQAMVNTFDPVAGTINTRALPQHYNDNSGQYAEGISCSEATEQGFYVCDLSKDAADYVQLDWSKASQWKSKISRMTFVHYEMGNMSVKYDCQTTDGKTIVAWVPITGANAGKVVINTDDSGDAAYDVKVVVNM